MPVPLFQRAVIGLGSNLGDRQSALDSAVTLLRRHPKVSVQAVSRWRETSPIGGRSDQNCFLNGALRLETQLQPHELLAVLQNIENELGRRREERWGPRTIDLDLLLYGDLTLDSPDLKLPHPQMAWRRFAIEPACEIAGEMVHPTTRWTISRLLDHLNSTRPYVAITGGIGAGKTRLAERLGQAISTRLVLERPDWKRLEAFYSDPAELGLETELEFLAHRAELLAADSPQWSDVGWTISDFWFDQSAAFARVWLSEEKLSQYMRRYETARRGAVRPRLVVLLDVPADDLLARVHVRGRRCERRLTSEQLDRIRRAVCDQAELSDVGPVLRIDGGDESAFAEALAAIQGME